jgi:peptide chain release factor 1
MQAAGGSESSLFAEEILDMYKNFCKLKGWRFTEQKFQEDMQIQRGCKYALFNAEGENCFKFLKYESGVHKV